MVVDESTGLSDPSLDLGDWVMHEAPVSTVLGYMTVTMSISASCDSSRAEGATGHYPIAIRMKPAISSVMSGPFFVQHTASNEAAGTRFETNVGWPQFTPLYTSTGTPPGSS